MKKQATIALNAVAAAVVLACSATAHAAPASFALTGYDASSNLSVNTTANASTPATTYNY